LGQVALGQFRFGQDFRWHRGDGYQKKLFRRSGISVLPRADLPMAGAAV
jgi:hypothetical protein